MKPGIKRELIKIASAVLLVFSAATLRAANPDDKTVFTSLPIKEITVFKDGHAYVLHEGKMPADKNGNVSLDYLPNPVLGTFWAYSADAKVKLSSVISARKIITLENTALNVQDLIYANIGKRVLIKDSANANVSFEATIIDVPERSTEELALTGRPSEEQKLPVKGNIILLKVAGGIKAVQIGSIQEITFLDNPNEKLSIKDFRNVMTLKLDWANQPVKSEAEVGMSYVQKGIRWIPGYKIDIDGKGNAVVKLQATIINELADLENVKANFVIGVPSFAFKDTADPMSLQQTFAQLSPYFQADSRTAYSFSNAIMSQAPLMRSDEYQQNTAVPPSRPVDLGPEIKGSEQNEDLFVFTVDNITLKKGQRMVFPITQFNLKYSDIYKLELPFAPPIEARRSFNSSQQLEIAKLLNAPKAKHYMRLFNDSKYPLTTSPALLLKNGKVISQAMMTYTSIGGRSDIELSVAVDVSVKQNEQQTLLTPNAINISGYSLSKVDMSGQVELTNHKQETIKIEIRRNLYGNINSANLDGKIEQSGFGFEGWSEENVPFWWSWYNWPWWWYRANSFGKINWELELKAGEKIQLEYTWHYFWG